MYNVFANKDDTDTTATTTTNVAALTTGSTITATIPELVANAINHLSANQTALMNQMAVMLYPNEPLPLQTNSANHQSSNSPFQCSNLLSGLHQAGSTMQMEEVAGWSAADRDAADVGAVVINAHHS
jgi:hypothetical protein